VIVLDDAFQHRKLFRDIDIVLLDYNKPVGNARLLPAGSLREPVTSLLRSNCIIFTRSEKDNDGFRGDDHENLGSYIKDKPVFYASHVPYLFALINSCYKRSSGHLIPNDKNDLVFLNGRKAIAFSGIARNDDFKNTLQQLSCNLQGFTGFPDHHKYSDQDFNEIIKSAIGSGTDYIITTEKDYARIPEDLLWPIDLVVIGIKISLGEDEAAFIKFLQNRPG
jgi:tetraacyldisaccharide 4'-kinase